MASISFNEGFNNTCTIIKASQGEHSKKKPCYCILNLYHFKEYVNVRIKINMDKYDYYQRFRSIQYKFWRAKE